MMNLSNYLFFTTSCQQALEFYTECGLGEVTSILHHGDNEMPCEFESMRGKIMHAHFQGPGVGFFASDNHDAEPMKGAAMIFMLDDADQTKRLFVSLAAGGQVTTPFGIQPWGDLFGKLTDKFGVQWMFNCTSANRRRSYADE
jgi:PhnB protein